MKKEYVRPEYDTDYQLNDVILASVTYDSENKNIDVNIDIGDIF